MAANKQSLVIVLLGVIMVTSAMSTCCHAANSIDLSGTWGLRLDPGDEGVEKEWFNDDLADFVVWPGSLDENEKGTKNTDEPKLTKGNLKRLTRKYKYVGAAWYQRKINIPKEWKGKRITLNLERVLWESTVWIDGKKIGMADSLIVPHVHDITKYATTGEHTLTVRIDNSYKYNVGSWDNHPGNPLGHAYTEETQTMWNGVIGDISINATDVVYVGDVQVYPDLGSDSAKVKIQIVNESGKAVKGAVTLQARSSNTDKKHVTDKMMVDFEIAGTVGELEIDYPMGDGYAAWDEFSPGLYDLEVVCDSAVKGEKYKDSTSVRFGMREFKRDKTIFRINGRRAYLRGTLECCIFPLTGYPPTDVDEWRRIIRIAKSYGLNHFRFHSWCPPEGAFAAADIEGFYLQTELPIWIQNAGKEPVRDKFIKLEAGRLLKEYGNHPSFCLLSLGNELMGDYSFLQNLVTELKAKDTRHLYTSTTFSFQWEHGRWPEKVDDFFVTQQTTKGWTRGQGFVNDNEPSTDFDFAASLEGLEVPLITHEIGQSTVYPNMEEIGKYTGVLKPLNFMAIKNDLAIKGLLKQARDFTNSTGQFAVELYKTEIELALRTEGTSGFQLLDLHDFPGQGTALVGVLDAFWDTKGLIEPKCFRRFCSPTVPLARMSKLIYTNDETLEADIEIAHFGKEPIKDAQVEYVLRNSKGEPLAGGIVGKADLPIGNGTKVGKVSVALGSVGKAEKLNLEVIVKGTEFANDWDVWVYPAKLEVDEPSDILIAEYIDEKVIEAIDEGGKVLLLPKGSLVNDKIAGRFVPVFWSPVHFTNQPGTMGVLCDPEHRALAEFPTESFSDWQWWDLNINSVVMKLDGLGDKLKPIVQIVDNFSRNHKLGTVIELKVGKADIIVCSIDLVNDLAKRPAARQLRYSLIEYMKTADFSPKVRLDVERLKSMFREAGSMLGAKVVSADSEQDGYPAENVIDGDPKTIWSTAWSPVKDKHPHEIVIDLGEEVQLKGFTYLPRQDGNPNGWVKDYEFYFSADGKKWGEPVATGIFEENMSLKKVLFYDSLSIYSDDAIKGRFLRFVAKTGFGSDPYTTIAELNVLLD